MKRLFKACGSIWSLFMLLALSGPAMAATYTGIDCPDSFGTEPRGINDRGDIVGVCDDANGTHGFRLRKGVFKLINFPGAFETAVMGSNNLDHVVGFYDDGVAQHAFLLRNGRFTIIDPPGSVQAQARHIDDLGRIIGAYLHRDGHFRGYIRDSRGYRDITVPGAEDTGPLGINVLGRIVGGSTTGTDVIARGYYLKDGVFKIIQPPAAEGAWAFGITFAARSSAAGVPTQAAVTASLAHFFTPPADIET
jgi:hypothetical protein